MKNGCGVVMNQFGIFHSECLLRVSSKPALKYSNSSQYNGPEA
jgi:hypothetical protein